MEKTDIILCLKKRKTKRISIKLLWGQKIYKYINLSVN